MPVCVLPGGAGRERDASSLVPCALLLLQVISQTPAAQAAVPSWVCTGLPPAVTATSQGRAREPTGGLGTLQVMRTACGEDCLLCFPPGQCSPLSRPMRCY